MTVAVVAQVVLDISREADMEDDLMESNEQSTDTCGWVPTRAVEILDSCGLCRESWDLGDEEAQRDKRKRRLLRPLAQEIASMENDLRLCTRRDTRYFALLKAYESALVTLKKM